ncbi:MAG TPA: hypothetical protein VG892_13125 [Terriglobales bacterium]|nr:hypothetical protein [Terriglobales bacterium]
MFSKIIPVHGSAFDIKLKSPSVAAPHGSKHNRPRQPAPHAVETTGLLIVLALLAILLLLRWGGQIPWRAR